MTESPTSDKRSGLYALIGATTFLTLGIATLSVIFARSSAERHLAHQGEVDELRNRILRELDCSSTLATGDVFTEADVEMKCPSQPSATSETTFRLVRKRGDGGPTYLTEETRADGSGRMGDWLLRATCAKEPGRLVVHYLRNPSRQVTEKVEWASAPSLFDESSPACHDFLKRETGGKDVASHLSGGFFGMAVSVPPGTKFNAKSYVVPRGKQLVIHNLSIDPQFNRGTVRCYLTTQEASGLLGYLNKYASGGSILKKLDYPATVRGPAQIMFLAEGAETDQGSGCHYVGLLESHRAD